MNFQSVHVSILLALNVAMEAPTSCSTAPSGTQQFPGKDHASIFILVPGSPWLSCSSRISSGPEGLGWLLFHILQWNEAGMTMTWCLVRGAWCLQADLRTGPHFCCCHTTATGINHHRQLSQVDPTPSLGVVAGSDDQLIEGGNRSQRMVLG